MGNANSYNHTSLRHDGEISRRRRRMNHHPDRPHIALNDDPWLDNDQSVSSTEANEPPHDYDDDAPSSANKVTLPIFWNVRLRAVDQGNNECPVCAIEFEVNDAVALLPCGHYFCKDCMTQWMNHEKSTCPLCRHDLQASATARKQVYSRVAGKGNAGLANAEPQLPTVFSPTSDNGLDRNFDLIMAKMLKDRAMSSDNLADDFSISTEQ